VLTNQAAHCFRIVCSLPAHYITVAVSIGILPIVLFLLTKGHNHVSRARKAVAGIFIATSSATEELAHTRHPIGNSSRRCSHVLLTRFGLVVHLQAQGQIYYTCRFTDTEMDELSSLKSNGYYIIPGCTRPWGLLGL
jgi:hypothetical protein